MAKTSSYYKKALKGRALREGNMTKKEVKEANEEYFKKHPGKKRQAEEEEQSKRAKRLGGPLGTWA